MKHSLLRTVAPAFLGAVLTLPSAHAALLKVIDFETGNLTQTSSTEIEGPTASVTASTTVARRGTYSMRAYIQTADKRAEITSLRGTVGGTHWYGWSIYAPAGYIGDGNDDIVSQFHDWHNSQPAWAKDGVAPTCFTFKNGSIGFGLKYQSAAQTTAHRYYTLCPYTSGAWHDIIVNVKWTHLSTGFLKIWVNGVLRLDYTGPTYLDYGAGNGPYFKMGNYKGVYNWPGTSPRTFYMDEFRMGDASSSYDEVNPLTGVYEGFNYTASASIAGANGGSGWASAWSVSGGAGVAITPAGGFTYTGLPVSGNRFQIYDTDGTHQTATRTLSRTYGAGVETYWISFLARKYNTGREVNVRFGGLDFSVTTADWRVKTPATAYTTITGATQSALHLFVARVDSTSTGDTVRVWKDPVISAGTPSSANALVTLTDSTGFSFNTVTVRHGPYGNNSQMGECDEIRIGATFDSVVTNP